MSRSINSHVIHDDVTLTAGAANTTSDVLELGRYPRGSGVFVKLSNGATGPTVVAQCQLQVSLNGEDFYSLTTVVGSASNNAVVSAVIDVPSYVSYLRFVSGSNTAQAVTLRVEVAEISAD